MPGKELPLIFRSDTGLQTAVNWEDAYHKMNLYSQPYMGGLELVKSCPGRRCGSIMCRSWLQTFYRIDITLLLVVAQSPPIIIKEFCELVRERTKCQMYHSLRCRISLHVPWLCRLAASEEPARTEVWNRLRTKHKARRAEVVDVETIVLQVLPVVSLLNCYGKDRLLRYIYLEMQL